MNISNFENFIDPVILSRGEKYFSDGAIASLRADKNTYIAYINGTRRYKIRAEMTNSGDILDMRCTCPFDMGPICKHQVALMYAVRDFQKNGAIPVDATMDALQKLSKEELISIISDMSNADLKISRMIKARLAGGDEAMKNVLDIVREPIRGARDRYGFVDWKNMRHAVTGMETALNMMNGESAAVRVATAALILKELEKLVSHGDDSNGEGFYIYEMVMGNLILNANDTAAAGDLLDFIKKNKSGFFDWEKDLIEKCVPCCGDKKIRSRVEKQLDDLKYGGAAPIRYKIAKLFDGAAVARDFLGDNSGDPELSKTLIEELISENRYAEAERLCIANARNSFDEFYPRARLRIYEKTGNMKSLRETSAELVAAHNRKEDYEYFKSLYDSADWKATRDDLVKQIRGARTGSKDILEYIFVSEKMYDDLFEHCKDSSRHLSKYYKYLIPKRGAETAAIIEKEIYEKLENMYSTSRAEYENICSLIKPMMLECDKVRARKLIATLVEKYPRRRALLEELSKI
jgi:hypothetical protein